MGRRVIWTWTLNTREISNFYILSTYCILYFFTHFISILHFPLLLFHPEKSTCLGINSLNKVTRVNLNETSPGCPLTWAGRWGAVGVVMMSVWAWRSGQPINMGRSAQRLRTFLVPAAPVRQPSAGNNPPSETLGGRRRVSQTSQ